MANLIPDVKNIEFQGINARTPLDLMGGERYRLALCPELNATTPRAVLLVQMTLQFFYEDGKSKVPATKGQPLIWTQSEKDFFTRDFMKVVKELWNNKFRIITDSTIPDEQFRDVGVQFQFKPILGGWDTSDDYELTITKIDPKGFEQSYVETCLHNAELDSGDLTPKDKKRPNPQRAAAHEFGHMLGLRDEYQGANSPTPHWYQDLDSIMHSGETLRPRHYVPFARWITEQYSNFWGQSPIYRVQDTTTGTLWDLSNSRLS